MNDHDLMVAHMIHRKQEVAAVAINSILLQHSDRLSPEFLSMVTDMNAAWLMHVSSIDDLLMKGHEPIVAIAGGANKIESPKVRASSNFHIEGDDSQDLG